MSATLYLKHSSGAMHDYGFRRTAKLRRECLAGRGTQEIVALMEAGYEGFLDSSGNVEILDALPAYFEATKD